MSTKDYKIQNIEMGKRIDKSRIEMNLSKQQFAKILNITGQHLGRVISGKVGISIDKLRELCEITDKSSDYYLFGTENTIEKLTNTLLSKHSKEEIEVVSNVIDNMSKIFEHKLI